MLNAHWYPTMPSGPEAHSAAHCEPIPGDWPEEVAPPVKMPADAVSPNEPLDAIHALGAQAHPTKTGGPVGGASAGAARAESTAGGGGRAQEEEGAAAAGGGGGSAESGGGARGDSASKPADDPAAIKAVVRDETLADNHPHGSESV